MERNISNYYDLAGLIEHGCLNIRKVAEYSKNLTAGAYFEMLSDLLASAPKFAEDLQKLMSRDGDHNIYKNLAGMFSKLKKLGYDKHEVEFDGMLDAYERGHARLTSVYAKTILDDFGWLKTRVEAARLYAAQAKPSVDPYKVALIDWIERRHIGNTASKPVILAVDDSPVILKSVSSLLGDDYKVYMLAKSDMLEMTLGKIKPDLFLLDYNMPVVNGFELIPVIRRFAEHKDTPIVFLTSEGTMDNLTSAVMLGASDFIAKPVKPDILRDKISKHISKKIAS